MSIKEIEADLLIIKKHLSNISFGEHGVDSVTDLEAIAFACRLIALQLKHAAETGDTI